MKKTLWIWVLVAALAIGGGYWYSRKAAATKAAAQAPAYDTVQVARQDIDVVVSASGTVKLSQVVNVRPTVSGTVKALYVKVGDRVRAGQPLLRLDDQDLRDRLAQAREALVAAKDQLAKRRSDFNVMPTQLKAQLESAKAALASAEQKLTSLKQGLKSEEIDQLKSAVNQAVVSRDNAQADYQRMKDLYSAQAITRQQFETAEAKYLTAQESVTQAKKKLAASTLPPDPADLAAAEAQVAQAKANLDLARANLAAGNSADQVTSAQSGLVQAQVAYDKARENLAGAVVAAPTAGVIVDLLVVSGKTSTASTGASALSTGDAVSPESGWVSIADPSLVEVHVPVDETDIAKVKLNQPAKITADALEGQVFHGTVTNVAPVGTLSDGVVTFNVTVSLVDRRGLLKSGMTTSVDIITAHHPQVLALLKEAVTERRGNPAVQVAATGNRYRRVETGFANDTYVEIVSGLTEGQTVLVPKPVAQSQNAKNGQSGQRRTGGFGFGPPSGR
jgi:HlyD family secretion protein